MRNEMCKIHETHNCESLRSIGRLRVGWCQLSLSFATLSMLWSSQATYTHDIRAVKLEIINQIFESNPKCQMAGLRMGCTWRHLNKKAPKSSAHRPAINHLTVLTTTVTRVAPKTRYILESCRLWWRWWGQPRQWWWWWWWWSTSPVPRWRRRSGNHRTSALAMQMIELCVCFDRADCPLPLITGSVVFLSLSLSSCYNLIKS